METTRIGEFSLSWGESLCWDDQRSRLYFVDCGKQRVHWLEAGEPPLHSMQLDSVPTGLVLADDGRIVIALDEGLDLVDPDSAKRERLSPYPDGLGRRANDATVDLAGNLVTGTLNLGPGDGSYWWFSTRDGWRQLDDGISNANGPVTLDLDGEASLVFADTPAQVLYSYTYDAATGSVSERRRFGEIAPLGGAPDGACADAEDGIWSCVLAAGLIARFTTGGLDRTIEAGSEQPSDVTFGGTSLDRLYVVSIAVDLGIGPVESPLAGALLAIDGTGASGVPENRFRT